ncbi:hypothetical protein ACFYSC_08440 [Streptosporangium sp. NPDC004379]|uniref:hypothetical protein n=1 Tax=Streptosporangium sp. NPDC004379 TaxID=3366189 RepID=UPI00367F0359
MIVNVAVAGLLLLAPGPQPDGGGGGGVRTSQSGNTSRIELYNSQIRLSGSGLGAKSDGYQVKRHCWYEPGNNAEDEMKFRNDRQNSAERTWGETPDDGYLDKYKDKVGQEGRWWHVAHDGTDAGVSCFGGMEPEIWVPPNTTPPNAITMQELLDIARAALTVPEPKIKLNPDVKSYVNLPTWVWLDDVGQTTRSVTATIPGYMSATVTANLHDMTIKSGTTEDRARVMTDCGPTGKPYTKGGTFTCGVQYLHASVDQPREVYELTVTSVWEVTAQGQGGVAPFAYDPYDPIQVGATRDVEVGEVQSTVTGTG